MPLFSYTAKSISGETKTGTQEASSETELAQILRKQDFVLTGVKPTSQPLKIKNRLRLLLPGITGVSLTEKMMNIKRLKDVGSYRGSRHVKGLPVRGQRTKTNTRTVRGNVRKTMGSGRKTSSEKT